MQVIDRLGTRRWVLLRLLFGHALATHKAAILTQELFTGVFDELALFLTLFYFIVVLEAAVVGGPSTLVINHVLVPVVFKLLDKVVDFWTFE